MTQAHPRQTLRFFLILALFVYQSVATVVAVTLFYLAGRIVRRHWKSILLASLLVFVASAVWFYSQYPDTTLLQLGQDGFWLNLAFYEVVFKKGYATAVLFVWQAGKVYLLGLPLLFLMLLASIDFIPFTAHDKLIRNIGEGNSEQKKELTSHQIKRQLEKLQDVRFDGTLLGVSKWTGKPVVIPDKDVNQMLLVLGTTGAGKTVTLRRFYQRALIQGYSLIILDGKPTAESVAWIKQRTLLAKRPFYGFACDEYRHYNPFAQGGQTELKDKIMTLKDKWENDYYKSVAEDYLQTTLEVLLSANDAITLEKIVTCLDFDELAGLVRSIDNPTLQQRVKRLSLYEKKDIAGLQAHLSVLFHSEMGEYFKPDNSTFTLEEIVQKNGVAYFALPALRYPEYAKSIGKLIINDIKTFIDRRDNAKPLFLIFDEFSVFAGEQVLNIVNMGRGKGVHAVFGTQGVPDLKTVSQEFAEQLLNCCNSLICHRVNDVGSIEAVTTWAGTQERFTVTTQIDNQQGSVGNGSIRRTKEFIIHPDEIKQDLLTGEAFYMTKIKPFKAEKIAVKF